VPRQFAHVSRSVNMELGFKENLVAVIAFHKCGKSDSQIFKLLKPLKISRNFVYRAIKRYKELWGAEDRDRSERLESVRAEAAIKTVRGQIRPKSALETEDHVPRAEHIDPIKSCLIRDDLHTTAHLRSKGNPLTPALKEIRRTRADCLLQYRTQDTLRPRISIVQTLVHRTRITSGTTTHSTAIYCHHMVHLEGSRI